MKRTPLPALGTLVILFIVWVSACDDEPPTSDGDADGDVDGDADGDSDGDGDGDCGDSLHEGEATYYDFADGSGNCGFLATPDDLMVAAMNHTDYDGSAACGACIHATGPSGEVTVRIVDRCPECPEGDVDFSPSAFEHIAELHLGRVPIQWRYVPCDVTGPIRYHFQDGSNEWWTSVQVRNHRHRIARFEFRDDSGSWVEVPREEWNFFIWSSGMGPGPYRFRVTDVHGHTLTDSGIEHMEGGEVEGASQFPGCGE